MLLPVSAGIVRNAYPVQVFQPLLGPAATLVTVINLSHVQPVALLSQHITAVWCVQGVCRYFATRQNPHA